MADKNPFPIPVALETGKIKAFASAVDWPGWSRGGRDEPDALQRLFDYRQRYAQAIETSRIKFRPPGDLDDFEVVERLKGKSGTDYGVPEIPYSGEAEPLDGADLRRLRVILEAIFLRFDQISGDARGVELSKGPRGGGRETEKIIEHVVGAQLSYLKTLGWTRPEEGPAPERMEDLLSEIRDALDAAVRGELPEKGPRGGDRWKPRYFIRRSAWHALDHVWEIEDRRP